MSKNPTIRYRIIYDLLCNGHKLAFDDLRHRVSEKLNVYVENAGIISPRTLADDIAVMRKEWPLGLELPVIRKNGYVYINEAQKKDVATNKQENEGLDEFFSLLKNYEWIKFSPFFSVLEHKTEQQKDAKNLKGFVEFHQNKELLGIQHLEVILKAKMQGKQIEIVYRPFAEDEITGVYTCFKLKEYNNRWYALCADNEDVYYSYALDRIYHLKISKQSEQKNVPKVDFSKILGVSMPRESKLEYIKLKVAKEQGYYERTKPIHSSQKMRYAKNGDFIIELEVIPNFELEMEILKRGERVEVIEPKWLRNKIAERLQLACKKYIENNK